MYSRNREPVRFPACDKLPFPHASLTAAAVRRPEGKGREAELAILVQKFGGTSLATDEARKHVLRHIVREREAGYSVVVVVSAMGRRGDPYATDTLLALAGDGQVPARERDLIASCGEVIAAVVLCGLLCDAGVPAVVLTGGQAGIRTDGRFGAARIVRVETEPVLRRLDEGKVVIVTGFQGMSPAGDTTTLGRGGSDTTAAALGAALRAQRIDIYTDVDGILTADPRVVADARPLKAVTYAEISNLARQGAKVVHPRAVEVAAQAGIPLRIRSTFSDDEGTLVTSPGLFGSGEVPDRPIVGIAHTAGVTQLTVAYGNASPSDMQVRVFGTMARHGISIDFINVTPSGCVYTVFDADADRAIGLLGELGCAYTAIRNCAKVSVVGGGMNGVPGIMAAIVEALTNEGIPILQSADSNASIWVLVRQADMADAVRALHARFGLDRPAAAAHEASQLAQEES